MDVEAEIMRLQAENSALEMMFTGLCVSLIAHNPALESVVGGAFRYAENLSQVAADSVTGGEAQSQTRAIIEIIDALRPAVFSGKAAPKAGI
jgi:hypothetical protein